MAEPIPEMIPWHLPQLRAAREEILRGMAWIEAKEDPAFQRFMLTTLAPVKRRAKGGTRQPRRGR